jgi:hypothetical protein
MDKPAEPTPQIAALIDAMDQILADMGIDSLSVSPYAKANARVVFEPFIDPASREFFMSLELAQALIAENDHQPAHP